MNRRHDQLMRRALSLAKRGLGRTSPNPMVGAVLVRDGEIVGEGYHLYDRQEHAETIALRQAGPRARYSHLYVNLEPCAHQGRTPPCAERIIEAGVGKVFVALRDPNPLVSGKGISRLRDAGLEVEEGLLQSQAARLNESFLHFIQTGNPFLILKLAMSADGRIATGSFDSKWITSAASRQLAHRMRFEADAILVGVETVLRDDPSLDVRWSRRNRITKVVLDTNRRTPVCARLFKSGDSTILFHGPSSASDHRRPYPGGVELVEVDRLPGGLDWRAVLSELGRRRLTSLLVEGGGRVAASALRAGVINKLHLFYGPRLIGADGVPAIAELGVSRLQEAIGLEPDRIRRVGDDWLLTAYVVQTPGAGDEDQARARHRARMI